MSSYKCESCGHDGPLSEPCPICELLVSRALRGQYDLERIHVTLPREETRALLARVAAMRIDRAALVEQLAQRNREYQQAIDVMRRALCDIQIHGEEYHHITPIALRKEMERLCAT